MKRNLILSVCIFLNLLSFAQAGLTSSGGVKGKDFGCQSLNVYGPFNLNVNVYAYAKPEMFAYPYLEEDGKQESVGYTELKLRSPNILVSDSGFRVELDSVKELYSRGLTGAKIYALDIPMVKEIERFTGLEYFRAVCFR